MSLTFCGWNVSNRDNPKVRLFESAWFIFLTRCEVIVGCGAGLVSGLNIIDFQFRVVRFLQNSTTENLDLMDAKNLIFVFSLSVCPS